MIVRQTDGNIPTFAP